MDTTMHSNIWQCLITIILATYIATSGNARLLLDEWQSGECKDFNCSACPAAKCQDVTSFPRKHKWKIGTHTIDPTVCETSSPTRSPTSSPASNPIISSPGCTNDNPNEVCCWFKDTPQNYTKFCKAQEHGGMCLNVTRDCNAALCEPTNAPTPSTNNPTKTPTIAPTNAPTYSPTTVTNNPTYSPTNAPIYSPTYSPITANVQCSSDKTCTTCERANSSLICVCNDNNCLFGGGYKWRIIDSNNNLIRDVTDQCLQPNPNSNCVQNCKADAQKPYCCFGEKYINKCDAECNTCFDIDNDCELCPTVSPTYNPTHTTRNPSVSPTKKPTKYPTSSQICDRNATSGCPVCARANTSLECACSGNQCDNINIRWYIGKTDVTDTCNSGSTVDNCTKHCQNKTDSVPYCCHGISYNNECDAGCNTCFNIATDCQPCPYTINCIGEDQCKDNVSLKCAAGRPCIINCNGKSACKNAAINGSEAKNLIVNCKGEDVCKDTTLKCAANAPCIVNCNGKSGCKNTAINGSQATDLIVNCTGEDVCKDSNIYCGSGDCRMDCSGVDSCKNANKAALINHRQQALNNHTIMTSNTKICLVSVGIVILLITIIIMGVICIRKKQQKKSVNTVDILSRYVSDIHRKYDEDNGKFGKQTERKHTEVLYVS